jgi:hypothetical protein
MLESDNFKRLRRSALAFSTASRFGTAGFDLWESSEYLVENLFCKLRDYVEHSCLGICAVELELPRLWIRWKPHSHLYFLAFNTLRFYIRNFRLFSSK